MWQQPQHPCRRPLPETEAPLTERPPNVAVELSKALCIALAMTPGCRNAAQMFGITFRSQPVTGIRPKATGDVAVRFTDLHPRFRSCQLAHVGPADLRLKPDLSPSFQVETGPADSPMFNQPSHAGPQQTRAALQSLKHGIRAPTCPFSASSVPGARPAGLLTNPCNDRR